MSEIPLSQTSEMPDYLILPTESAPADYPFGSSPDEFSPEPFDLSYKSRREAFLAFVRRNPAPTNTKSTWHELGRMAAGGSPHLGIISAGLDYINARKDCSDHILQSLIRLFYQFKSHPSFHQIPKEGVKESLLNFRYWPDEPGGDTMCTWTENHYILFSTAGYLAGQLYPDDIFLNSGFTGEEQMKRHRSRILRWMNLRFFTGFSDWLSHVYYDEDLTALLNLVDFCQDEEIQVRASILIDLILLDMALNNFLGVFGSTHGRSFENTKKWAAEESTADTFKLLFGRGIFAGSDNMSAIAFALSQNYLLPSVLFDIANDQSRAEMLNRQHMGIRIDQARWWGMNFRHEEDRYLALTMEPYFHPRMVNSFIRMMDKYGWWENPFFKPLRKRKLLVKILWRFGLLPTISRLYEKDLARNTREEVNIYTYRTPNYMLSTAQDYKPGFGGDQQHIWQATLGPDAVCFTTHPPRKHGNPPNYWVGSGSLPRVAQVKNVVIAIYRIPSNSGIYIRNELQFTHAWLPRDCFEEVVEEDGWIFVRMGDGYLSLLSQHPYEWREMPGEDQGREVLVNKNNNIWLCELGRYESNGDFDNFMKQILAADVKFYDSKVSYDSPTQGHLEFGWKGPLRKDRKTVKLDDYPRYANPYAQTQFPSEHFSIRMGEHSLFLDWMIPHRNPSKLVESLRE